MQNFNGCYDYLRLFNVCDFQFDMQSNNLPRAHQNGKRLTFLHGSCDADVL